MEHLLKLALDLEAVKIDCKKPFRWASGYYMPIYTDNRIIVGSFKGRKIITDLFVKKIADIDYDYIAGTATAGIAPATSLADRLKKPLVYVRSSSKDHGTAKLIEGFSPTQQSRGKRVLLIEDAISTGGSSLKAVQTLQSYGFMLDTVCSIYSYGFLEAQKAFDLANLRLMPLFTYNDMIEFAYNNNYFSREDYESLIEWQRAPFDWGENHNFKRGVE